MTSRPPRVFIGSSSAARQVREALQSHLQAKGIDAEPWDQSSVFEPSKSTWENLCDHARDFDFAVFILTPDDRTTRRGMQVLEPRDNVILELGLFTGAIGRERVFLLVPSDIPELSNPSDLHGITYVGYNSARQTRIGGSALGPASATIAQYIRQRGPSTMSRLFGDIHSSVSIEQVFDTTAMTDAFPTRASAKQSMLRDIANAKTSIRTYSRVYVSEIVKDPYSFGQAVAESLSIGTSTLSISHTTCNTDNEPLLQALHSIEDPKRVRWGHPQAYEDHIVSARRLILEQREAVRNATKTLPRRRKFRLKLQVVDLIPAHSMLVIDDLIVYVSFYNLSPSKYGTHAPTLRLVNDRDKVDWADVFIAEADALDAASCKTIKSFRAT